MRVSMMAWTEKTDTDIYAHEPSIDGRQKMTLPRPKWGRIVILLLSIGLSLFMAVTLSHKFRAIYGGSTHPDFGEIYNGVRCLIHHQDPYNPAAALQNFRAEGGTFPNKEPWAAEVIIAINV